MRLLYFALAVILVFIFLILRFRKRNTLTANSASIPAGQKVLVEDETEEEKANRPKKGKGDTQELKRRIVHGEYQPIQDIGAPTTVQPIKEP